MLLIVFTLLAQSVDAWQIKKNKKEFIAKIMLEILINYRYLLLEYHHQ